MLRTHPACAGAKLRSLCFKRRECECYPATRSLHCDIQAKVSCYFVELYLDNLRDLFYAMDHLRDTNRPKLDIKMDAKKMVVIKNVVLKVRGLRALYDATTRHACSNQPLRFNVVSTKRRIRLWLAGTDSR